MRLIDADKLRLVKCGEFDSGKPINCVYEWAIKDAPTIKAIPIEWIENWVDMLKERNYHNYTVLMPALIEMLGAWEKENEQKEVNKEWLQ